MKGIDFEKILTHQSQAVENTLAVFKGLEPAPPISINTLTILSLETPQSGFTGCL